MKYRFKHHWRQYRPGDEVPESLGAGIVDTLKLRQRIEPIPDGEPVVEKAIVAPPVDKVMRPNRVSRKHALPTA